MQIALVNGQRVEAFLGGKGICPNCGSAAIAKCGPRIMHHWAHYRKRDCDPWWENETKWHRDWKNQFPKECREVSLLSDSGEQHRADIRTPTGIFIEIQHSSMTDEERISREEFYKNLVWIIDGSAFKNNFDIYHMLPDPTSILAEDIIWYEAKRHLHGAITGCFLRLSDAREEFPDITKSTFRKGARLYLYHWMHEIKHDLELSYNGYHQYDWIKPRKTWLESTCPVYIDFGNDYLVKLDTYDSYKLKCIRLVSKRKFIHDVMTESKVEHIATRFYPIESSNM